MRAQHLVDALDAPLYNKENSFTTALGKICSSLAAGNAPTSIAPWLAGAPIFPLKKKHGGIRPIAVGEVIRRLVGKLILNDQNVKSEVDRVLKEVTTRGEGKKRG